jgi:hypothetical protein
VVLHSAEVISSQCSGCTTMRTVRGLCLSDCYSMRHREIARRWPGWSAMAQSSRWPAPRPRRLPGLGTFSISREGWRGDDGRRAQYSEVVGRSGKALERRWHGTELKQWWSSVGAATSSINQQLCCVLSPSAREEEDGEKKKEKEKSWLGQAIGLHKAEQDWGVWRK